ncbi:MAG: DUF86 domain-containing protein [Prevotellaceae bacterium]|jgi:uncharacterized protein with HEPN domain|nr:DUF86 domain-containing protein [Prevotellaceae bacterium]
MREKVKDKTRLLHILEAIDNLFEFTKNITFEEYKANKVLRFAIIKNLEIIGEAAYLLTKEFKEEHPEIDWSSIIYMRHVLVHGYYQIKDDIVWATVQTDLKPLKEQIFSLNSL